MQSSGEQSIKEPPSVSAPDSEDSKTLTVTVRLIESSEDGVQEKQIKILPRVHVSHFLKVLSWSFNKTGFYNQDFDAFLVQMNGIEVHLDQNRKISEYGIKNQDIVEVRRKKQLMSLQVNIHHEDVREFQVNAAIPVEETIKSLGSMLGITNTKELSLAMPVTPEKNTATVSSIDWLDPVKSLNAQGLTSGDTVMLRKKFFIFNEDIGEAKHNPVLRDLLFHQLQNQLCQSPKEVTTRKVSLAYSYGIPSEASDLDSLSDHEGTSTLETGSSSLMADVMISLERARNDSNSESLKEEWIQTFSKSSRINSFTVKSPAHTEAQCLCIKSGEICLTVEPSQNTVESIQSWRCEDITSWEKLDNGVKIIADGITHTLFSEEVDEIAAHLSFITQKEASNGQQSVPLPTDEPLTANQGGTVGPTLSPAQSPTSGSLNNVTFSKESSPFETAGVTTAGDHHMKSEASNGSGAEALSMESSIAEYPSPFQSPQRKKEQTTNITPPAYFGMSYRELLDTHLLVNIIVLDQEIREILLDVTQTVGDVVKNICGTYGIQYPEEHYLRYPQSTEDIVEKYGGKPRLDSLSGEYVQSSNSLKCNTILDPRQPLAEQLIFDIQPVVLLLRRHNFDDVDAVEKFSLEIGNEWPDGEDRGVARYRYFYQSWMSVVQGYRKVDKHTAIKLAAILTYLYHGSRKTAPVWPPMDFDPKCFLPQKYQDIMGIEKDILKAHKKYGDVEIMDAIEKVISIIEDIPSSKGLSFPVKVPTKSDILRLKKLEERTFCVTREGIVCDSNCGKKEKCFVGEYRDISNWATSDTSFSLSFGGENADFYCYTYQARQIMEMIQIYVKMAYNDLKRSPKRSIGSMSDV